MSLIRVGEKFIGSGQPCFIAAEIGINHNGDMLLAKQMIDAAAKAGADAVKFQNYRTEDFLSDRKLTYTYESQGIEITEAQFDMFKRCELSLLQLQELNEYSESKGVLCFSTPTGEDGIQNILAAEMPLIKNGSDYLTHLPLIRTMARTGLPIILSTGMATYDEVEDAILAFQGAGGAELIILHCTSSYPTPANEVNLRSIKTLAEAFSCQVGFSDHSWGTTAAIGAVAMGACFIEKHFTLSKNLPGPDHRFSSDPEEFGELVTRVRELEQNLGSPNIGPTASEVKNRLEFRLSCVASRDLPAGHKIELKDIEFKRPGLGLAPKHAESIVGLRTSVNYLRGDIFQFELLE